MTDAPADWLRIPYKDIEQKMNDTLDVTHFLLR